jgi:hypothetical protein
MLLFREWSTENSSLEVDTEKVEMDKSTNVFVNFGKFLGGLLWLITHRILFSQRNQTIYKNK